MFKPLIQAIHLLIYLKTEISSQTYCLWLQFIIFLTDSSGFAICRLLLKMCPLDFCWRHNWMFPWQFATAGSLLASVFDIELKLHYYLVNGAIVRNYWNMTAPMTISETLKCNFSASKRQRKILLFWKKWLVLKGLFLLPIFNLTSPCVFSSDQRAFLERQNISLANITKIFVSKKRLSLQPFFLTVRGTIFFSKTLLQLFHSLLFFCWKASCFQNFIEISLQKKDLSIIFSFSKIK